MNILELIKEAPKYILKKFHIVVFKESMEIPNPGGLFGGLHHRINSPGECLKTPQSVCRIIAAPDIRTGPQIKMVYVVDIRAGVSVGDISL